MQRNETYEYLLAERENVVRKARMSFWNFCKALHDYKDEWGSLHDLCDTLQALYERKLLDSNNKPYKKLMINMPPRHYKTRTLILFSTWCFGVNPKETIISTSYSDDLATEFSRYTRDEINKEKNFDYEIVYSDIFPESKIKHGDASYKKWALEGCHFSYKGAGFGASITGKGAKIAIIDDQIKDYEEAMNEMMLEKRWNWYTGTFKSRIEQNAIEIICMTRWSDRDICGMILNNPKESSKWHRMVHEVEKDGIMLCDDMLNHESFIEKQEIMDEAVFIANYYQRTVDQKGKLYQELKTYDRLPEDKDGRLLSDRVLCYVDTADEGVDYLCAIAGIEYHKCCYITDIYYTQEPQEITESKTTKFIIANDVKDCMVESNNGGRAFSRNVKRLLTERLHYSTILRWFHQSKNKNTRILTNASNVERRIFFPVNWHVKYPKFYLHVNSYMRNKNNKHDDAEDTLTGIIEMMDNKHVVKARIDASHLGL